MGDNRPNLVGNKLKTQGSYIIIINNLKTMK